jgi:hypothetical protein
VDGSVNVNAQAVLTALAPVMFAAVGYLIMHLNDLENRMYKTESRMMQLVTPEGQIVPSPDNAIARQNLREQMMHIIHDLQVRISLLENKGH